MLFNIDDDYFFLLMNSWKPYLKNKSHISYSHSDLPTHHGNWSWIIETAIWSANTKPTLPEKHKNAGSVSSLCMLSFIFHQKKAIKNYGQYLLLHLKCYFSSSDIQGFYIFILLIQCLKRRWEQINYDIMRDDFHKLTIVFFRIHEQFFQLDHYKWPGNGSLKKLRVYI